jgi:CubicO group peptidase (beta-lactamase class C family)
VSTAQDYVRFCQMLLGEGALGGHRLLGRKTVELLGMNHLPTGGDLTSMGQPVFSETRYDGIGFGLGFSVLLDPARAQIAGSPGELAWGGMASTAFWVDPHEDLAVVFMTQLLPSSSYPLRRELRTLVHAAIVD